MRIAEENGAPFLKDIYPCWRQVPHNQNHAHLGLILMTLWKLSTGRQSEEHKEAPCLSQACKQLRRRHTPPFHPEIARIFRRISECVSKKM